MAQMVRVTHSTGGEVPAGGDFPAPPLLGAARSSELGGPSLGSVGDFISLEIAKSDLEPNLVGCWAMLFLPKSD